MWPGKCPGSSNAVTPSASSVSPPISSKSTARDRAGDVRPVGRARERDAVAVRDVARVREDELAVHGPCSSRRDRRGGASGRRRRCPSGATPASGERRQQPLLPLRRPSPTAPPGRHRCRRERSCRRSGSGTTCRGCAIASRRTARDSARVRAPSPTCRETAPPAPRACPPRRRAARARPSRLATRRLTRRPTAGSAAAPARRAPPATTRPGCGARRSARSRPRSRHPASGRAAHAPRAT